MGNPKNTTTESIGTTRLTLGKFILEASPRVMVLLLGGLILLAAAVVLDDMRLDDYTLRLLDVVAKLLGGAAVLFGAFRYIDERDRRLKWDKTKFITELFEDFDSSSHCQLARRVIDRAYHLKDFSYLERVLGDPSVLSEEDWNVRDAIDQFLDFFDQLYTHVYMTKTLSPEDVSSFSGYVIQVVDSRCLTAYALDWGYEDIVEFAAEFDPDVTERIARVHKRETEFSLPRQPPPHARRGPQ